MSLPDDFNMSSENTETKAALTEEEASRYDRQMRLWGIEAQQRYVERFSIQTIPERGPAVNSISIA